jgi:hypothetical protein
MPIWRLEEIDGVDLDQWAIERGDRHFSSVECRGFVVAAVDETEALRLACEEDRAGCEGTVCERRLDANVTSCVCVADDRSRLIMANWPTE